MISPILQLHCRSLDWGKAQLREQVCPGSVIGGERDNKVSAATSFSGKKEMCVSFANDHWSNHDRDGNPLCPGRAIIVLNLNQDCPDICVVNLLEHLQDFDPPLPQHTQNWLRGGICERNAITSPDGISGRSYEVVGRDGRYGPGVVVKPGDYRFIPDVLYGPSAGQDVGLLDVMMTKDEYDKLGKQHRRALEELHAKGGARLMIFSSRGGKDGYPVFNADKILQDDGMNHGRPCHMLVGTAGSRGISLVKRATFLSKYNEACAVKNHQAAASSSQAQGPFFPCTVSTIGVFRNILLPKQVATANPTPVLPTPRRSTLQKPCKPDLRESTQPRTRSKKVRDIRNKKAALGRVVALIKSPC
jgi:hypothetical protein